MGEKNLILKLFYNNFSYSEFHNLKNFYEFSESIYNNDELDRRSGKKYITHINDLLKLSLDKYSINDFSLTKIIIGHDILEENDSLYKKTNSEKGYKRDILEKKLLDFIDKYDLNGIKCLTHDEDISKLEKVSKVIDSNDLRYIIAKSIDIIANSNDHPENLRFESKLNKVLQAEMVISNINYKIKNLRFLDFKNNFDTINYDILSSIVNDLEIGKKNIFQLALNDDLI